MWGEQFAGPAPGHMPYNVMRMSKSPPCSPIKPTSKRSPARGDPSFHIVHKVPVGDTPYVKAKHVQLVDKDPDRAIALFWAAINAGDHVDSALKDMAIVMKQQNRPHEAVEAIKSLRNRCSDQAQESLDNVLLDLYKRCGRLEDQIDLLKHKLHLIHQGMAFNGRRTKTARSQGKKFQVSVEQEATRLLGNLGWAYMQQSNFVAAEAVYRKALTIESDNNKVCNLGICLMKQGRLEEAKAMLQSVTPACNDSRWASDSHLKSYERAQEMLQELEASIDAMECDKFVQELISFAIPGCDPQHFSSLWRPQPALPRQPRRISRPTTLELQLSQPGVDPCMTGALLATSGFGPQQPDVTTHGHARLVMDMGSFRNHPGHGPIHGERLFQSESWLLNQGGSSGGWEDDDFNYSSPDDSSDGSDAQGYQQDPINGTALTVAEFDSEMLQWHAETLGQRLESVSALKNALSDSPLRLKVEVDPAGTARNSVECDQSINMGTQPFNSNAAEEPVGTWSTVPFKRINTEVFENGWSRGDYDENQPTSRRSLSSGFGTGTQVMEQPSAVVQRSIGLPLLHTAAGKRSRTLTPVKEKTVTSAGGLLDDLDFDGRAINGQGRDAAVKFELADYEGLMTVGNLSASEMEMRRQRRLRVFQEMTLPKPLQV